MNGKTGKTAVLLVALLPLLLAGIPAYGGKSPDTSSGDGPKGVVTHSLPAGSKLHGTITVEYEYANGSFTNAFVGGVNQYKVRAYLRLLKNSNLQTFFLELDPQPGSQVSLLDALATQQMLMPYLRPLIMDRFFPQEGGTLCLFIKSASNFSEWYEHPYPDTAYGEYVAISDIEFAVNDNGGYCPGP